MSVNYRKLVLKFFLFPFLLSSSFLMVECSPPSGGAGGSNSDASSVSAGGTPALVTSSQKNADLTTTTMTLSSCTDANGAVSFISSAQSANAVKLPTPKKSNVTCTISLNTLAYTGQNAASFTFTPASTTLSGTVVINATTGGYTITPPGIATQAYNGSNSNSTNLVANVSFGVTGNQITISWDVNAVSNTVSMSTFLPTAGDAVPPSVTGVSLFNNVTSNTVAATLDLYNNSGAAAYSWTPGISSNATSVYAAKTVNNTTAGYQCFMFYDGSINTSKPTYYNAALSDYTSSTDFTSGQMANFSSAFGFQPPSSYAEAKALFQNAQTTAVKSGISKTTNTPGAAGPSSYYVTTGTKFLGFYTCDNLLTYGTSNWGGSSVTEALSSSNVTINFAHYAWFVIFGNNLNASDTAQTSDAYTVVKISAVSGQ